MNKASNCESYPVPRTEDLFASLGGGEKFTKLDLSHACQQLLLNPENHPHLTVNIHKECVKVPIPAHQVLTLTAYIFEASYSTSATQANKI